VTQRKRRYAVEGELRGIWESRRKPCLASLGFWFGKERVAGPSDPMKGERCEHYEDCPLRERPKLFAEQPNGNVKGKGANPKKRDLQSERSNLLASLKVGKGSATYCAREVAHLAAQDLRMRIVELHEPAEYALTEVKRLLANQHKSTAFEVPLPGDLGEWKRYPGVLATHDELFEKASNSYILRPGARTILDDIIVLAAAMVGIRNGFVKEGIKI